MPPQQAGNTTPPTPPMNPYGVPQVAPQSVPQPVPPASTPVPQPLTGAVSDDAKYSQPGWSWGAFMLGPYFLIGVRSYAYLWAYLLVLVPFVGPLLLLGFGIYLGMKGREMAAVSTTFHNKEQYIGFMRGVDHAGKIMFFVALVMVGLGLAFMLLFFGALFSGGDFYM